MDSVYVVIDSNRSTVYIDNSGHSNVYCILLLVCCSRDCGNPIWKVYLGLQYVTIYDVLMIYGVVYLVYFVLILGGCWEMLLLQQWASPKRRVRSGWVKAFCTSNNVVLWYSWACYSTCVFPGMKPVCFLKRCEIPKAAQLMVDSSWLQDVHCWAVPLWWARLRQGDASLCPAVDLEIQ